MGERPLIWMRVVRDAEPRFTAIRRAALWALALRMNADGTGFASTGQVAADVGADERTIRRATSEARDRGYLNRTRRGHRLGNGALVASEWELVSPHSQPDTGVLLSDASTGQGANLNRTETASQPDTGVPPGGLYQEGCPQEGKVPAGETTAGPAPEPPSRCPEHTDEPNPPPCGKCAGQRRAHEQWQRDEQTRKATLASLIKALRLKPPCEDGDPGGDQLHPETGEPLCPLCRRRARRTA